MGVPGFSQQGVFLFAQPKVLPSKVCIIGSRFVASLETNYGSQGLITATNCRKEALPRPPASQKAIA